MGGGLLAGSCWDGCMEGGGSVRIVEGLKVVKELICGLLVIVRLRDTFLLWSAGCGEGG